MTTENEGILFRPALLVFRKHLCHHSCSCTRVSISYLGPYWNNENITPPPPQPQKVVTHDVVPLLVWEFFLFFSTPPHPPSPFPLKFESVESRCD